VRKQILRNKKPSVSGFLFRKIQTSAFLRL